MYSIFVINHGRLYLLLLLTFLCERENIYILNNLVVAWKISSLSSAKKKKPSEWKSSTAIVFVPSPCCCASSLFLSLLLGSYVDNQKIDSETGWDLHWRNPLFNVLECWDLFTSFPPSKIHSNLMTTWIIGLAFSRVVNFQRYVWKRKQRLPNTGCKRKFSVYMATLRFTLDIIHPLCVCVPLFFGISKKVKR